MIRIINLRKYTLNRGEILVKVDRSNRILGNPFIMKDEKDRDLVCNQYNSWIMEKLSSDDHDVVEELNRIHALSMKSDIALGCWCVPKRCHAESILTILNTWSSDNPYSQNNSKY